MSERETQGEMLQRSKPTINSAELIPRAGGQRLMANKGSPSIQQEEVQTKKKSEL